MMQRFLRTAWLLDNAILSAHKQFNGRKSYLQSRVRCTQPTYLQAARLEQFSHTCSVSALKSAFGRPKQPSLTPSRLSQQIGTQYRQQRSLKLVMAEGPDKQQPPKDETDTILQYIVLRRDLYDALKWPLGSVIAQACHAATAALWESREESITQEYTAGNNINNMHKVVLEVKGETQLQNLSNKLQEAGIRHKLWMEQPEDIPTCIAAAPYRKSIVQPYFKKLKLCSS